MAYDFSISGSTLVVTLDTESGKFAESITVYSQPNLVLGNDRIFLKQEGLFLQEFTFENIGDINGDTATNLISAYELLDSLIKSIFVTTAQGDSRPYKVYSALLTQNETNAPTAIVLENELTNVVLLYDSVGFYKITFDEYIANKVLIFSGHSIYGNGGEIVKCSVNNYAPFGAAIFSLDNAGSPINGYIKDMPIEIRVYN